MQINLKHLALAAFAGGAMTFASCGEDDVDPLPTNPCDNNTAPIVTLENSDMSMSGRPYPLRRRGRVR